MILKIVILEYLHYLLPCDIWTCLSQKTKVLNSLSQNIYLKPIHVQMCRDRIGKTKAQMELNLVKDVKNDKKGLFSYTDHRR